MGTLFRNYVYIHHTVQLVAEDQLVRHADSVGFHWVPLTVVEVTDVLVVEIGYSSL